jgi:hypothetical protein
MNKEQQELLGDAYKNYLIEDAKILPNMSKEKMTELGYRLTQEEFINKCKTDSEFSERWGLKVDERELSLEERTEYKKKRDGISRTFASYTHQMLDGSNIPTKVISLTYNNQTEVIYE